MDKTPKEWGHPSGGSRKSRMVLASFVPESPFKARFGATMGAFRNKARKRF